MNKVDSAVSANTQGLQEGYRGESTSQWSKQKEEQVPKLGATSLSG